MNYTVTWLPAAENALAAIWTAAADRDAVTRAANELDPRLALNGQHDRALVVEPARDLVVLDAVDDASDLVELDRGAVAIGHNNVAVVGRVRKRTGSSEGYALFRSGQDADRRA